jgi:ABC-type uncharacterized transport system permease subunit
MGRILIDAVVLFAFFMSGALVGLIALLLLAPVDFPPPAVVLVMCGCGFAGMGLGTVARIGD